MTTRSSPSGWPRAAVLAVALGVAPAGAPLCAGTDTLSFEDALARAASRAPEISAAQAKVTAAHQSLVPAGALPDPSLAFGLDNVPIEGRDRYELGREAMTMQRIGLMQEFPNSAKREARRRAAIAREADAQAQARVARQSVLRATAVAWIARHTIERQLTQIDAIANENRLLDAAVRAQLAGGAGPATDIVLPRQEAAMIEERRDELVARRAQASAELRRFVGDDADAPLAGEAPLWSVESRALRHELHQHPELQAFGPRSRLLDAEVAEARAMKRPDWALELAYQKRGQEFGDMVSVQARFELPLFAGTRQDPTIAAKLAERQAIDSERDVATREHAALLEADIADHTRAARAEKRAREVLLPLADEKVALATAAWRTGRGPLAEVIEARRERIEVQLRTVALTGERQQIAARLLLSYRDLDQLTAAAGDSQ